MFVLRNSFSKILVDHREPITENILVRKKDILIK